MGQCIFRDRSDLRRAWMRLADDPEKARHPRPDPVAHRSAWAVWLHVLYDQHANRHGRCRDGTASSGCCHFDCPCSIRNVVQKQRAAAIAGSEQYAFRSPRYKDFAQLAADVRRYRLKALKAGQHVFRLKGGTTNTKRRCEEKELRLLASSSRLQFAMNLILRQVKTIEIHHLRPSRNEVADELVASIVTSVRFSNRAKLTV